MTVIFHDFRLQQKSTALWHHAKGMAGKEKEVRFEVFVFWLCRVMRVLEPIVRTYGRYPYRNGTVGRERTEEERNFMKLTDGFGAVDEETASIY